MTEPGYDEDQMTKEQRGGVAVVLQHPDGRILAVARKDDHTKWTLPGGKRDLGENFLVAAYREFEEEVGLPVYGLDIVWADVNDWNGKICVTYKASNWANTYLTSLNTFATPEGEAPVSWQPASVLVNGPFGAYNKRLFDYLGISYDETESVSP